MRAVICKALGSVDNLEVVERPSPVPGPNQVLVSVRSAGINFPDALKIQGNYQVKPEVPFTPGFEVAGVVSAIGSTDAEPPHFAIGDAVYGTVPAGGYAEEVVVDPRRLRRIPANRSFEEAACVPTTYGTAYYALIALGKVCSGDVVLVLGAGGGVGLAAIEVAKAQGARVIAAASSSAKLAACRERGADELINYSDEDMRASLKALTSGRGVDVVCDPVGGALAEQALRQLAWLGRYLVVGFAAGDIPRIPLNIVLLKGGNVIGVALGEAMTRDARLAKEIIDGVAALFSAGHIRPLVSGRYQLSQAAEALRALLERRALGKLVLSP